MTMRMRLSRLFTIKTRTEAWVVIYVLALGAVERGRHYLESYPGNGGLLLAMACTGVVFLAGAKLLDAVRPPSVAAAAGPPLTVLAQRPPALSRSRPRLRPRRSGSRSQPLLRRGSRPTRWR